MAGTSADPGHAPAARAPGRGTMLVTALGAGLAAALLYFVLPRFAPPELGGEMSALLLGIINGITVGAALRVPTRLTIPIAVGGSLGVFAWLLQVDGVEVFTVAVSVAVAAELWLFPTMLRRYHADRLQEPSDLLRYGGVVLAVTIPIGALVTTFALVDHLPFDDFFHAWRSWVIDDLFGLMIITPAILTFHRPSRWSTGRATEYVVAVAYTAVATWHIFFHVEPGQIGLLGWPYLVLLGSIWVAVRMGTAAVAPILAVQFWVAALGTVEGYGSFAAAAPDALDRLLAVELFSIIMSTVILALALLRDGRLASQASVERSERLLREVIDGSDSLIFAKSYEGRDAPRGRYVLVNRTWGEITGTSEAATIGRSDLDLWPEPVAGAFIGLDRRVIEGGQPVHEQEQNLDATGEMRQYQSSKFPLRRPDGSIWGVGGIASDITELLRTREREQRQAELLYAVFELSPTPAVRMSSGPVRGFRVEAANAAMCHLLAAPVGHVTDCDLLDHVHPDDVPTAMDVLDFAISMPSTARGTGVRQRELRMRTEDGRTVWVLMSAAALRGEDGEAELVAQFEDITARRAAEQALTEQAMRDAVTGLPNRRALQERLEGALLRLRRHPGWVTVLFCDLDHFKDVNDSLGHHVGDRLLVEVAERLQSALRPEDTIARLGGDEFVAIGEGITDPADATIMALRLQDRLSAPWVVDEQVFRPAMSIGIAMANDPDISVDELLRRADLAMYRAKEGGRNRIEIYEQAVDEEVQRAVAIQHEIRRAIDTDALVLHYQPIVRLTDREVVGMEALVRLQRPDGELLSPGAFVPQAEATGLVVPLGAWVLGRAFADLVALHRVRGHDTIMSVNVSPMQLREEGFADYLLEQLAFAGADPRCVSVEVTETALIHDPGHSARALTQLSEAGISISLDDFGTGYSSLSWLTQFPVNTVKIDRSFTEDVGIDDRKTAIISAVIAVSHELGFAVVAEGVETDDQARRLLDLGCDRGQGYLFGKPTPFGEPPWTT